MPMSVDIIQEDVETESGLEDMAVFRKACAERGAGLYPLGGQPLLARQRLDPGGGGDEAE